MRALGCVIYFFSLSTCCRFKFSIYILTETVKKHDKSNFKCTHIGHGPDVFVYGRMLFGIYLNAYGCKTNEIRKSTATITHKEKMQKVESNKKKKKTKKEAIERVNVHISSNSANI